MHYFYMCLVELETLDFLKSGMYSQDDGGSMFHRDKEKQKLSSCFLQGGGFF